MSLVRVNSIQEYITIIQIPDGNHLHTFANPGINNFNRTILFLFHHRLLQDKDIVFRILLPAKWDAVNKDTVIDFLNRGGEMVALLLFAQELVPM
jgi:hypothetical protein